MPLHHVMERRGVYEAREWDRSQECRDWMQEHGGMDGAPFSIDENGDLYQWGAFLLPQGTWLIYRGGWWDILPDQSVYIGKYEPVAEEAAAPAAPEAAGDTPPAGDDDAPLPPDDAPPVAGDTPPGDETPPAGDTPPDTPDTPGDGGGGDAGGGDAGASGDTV